MWNELDKLISEYLDGITIADLMEGNTQITTSSDVVRTLYERNNFVMITPERSGATRTTPKDKGSLRRRFGVLGMSQATDTI